MITTLRACKQALCGPSWQMLLQNLGKINADDEPLSVLSILNMNGIEDAIRCLGVVEDCDHQVRLFMARCARQIQHLMRDPRSVAAVDVAEQYARGKATDYELTVARTAARKALYEAIEVAESKWMAMWTKAGGAETGKAARIAAEEAWAARAAVFVSTAEARDTVTDTAWAAVRAVGEEARVEQEQFLREICTATDEVRFQ